MNGARRARPRWGAGESTLKAAERDLPVPRVQRHRVLSSITGRMGVAASRDADGDGWLSVLLLW